MDERNGVFLRAVYFNNGDPIGHQDPASLITNEVCERVFDRLKAANYEIPDDFDVGKIAEIVLGAFDDL